MAVKKKSIAGAKSAGPKAGKGTAKETTPKANGVAKATKTTKVVAPTKTATAAPAPKKPAAPVVKLNDRQKEFLTKVGGAGEAGYTLGHKTEQRTIDALIERKLVKKGAKNKETGQVHYLITKAGAKHAATSAAPSA